MPVCHTIGTDFGTESARALLVEVATGREVAEAEVPYRSLVIDRVLPSTGESLPPEWALQDPDDYLDAMVAAVRAVMQRSGVDAGSVIGIGIDFTSCTILPVHADGTPLARDPTLARDPHAWVKLWKHHAAQRQADRINALAKSERKGWLSRYGGKISCEWLWPKVLEILEESPTVYGEAERILEAEDWLVWQLTGHERRARVAASYKAIYLRDQGGYPEPSFFRKLAPGLAATVEEKLSSELYEPGENVGGLCEDLAKRLGLRAGTAVATANMDAVASVAACGVVEPFAMVMVMGTSVCDLVLAPQLLEVEGICGAVEDAVVPGLWAYESGQASVGDLFGWFARTWAPGKCQRTGETEHESGFAYLERAAARLVPGESGLLALDWWNGNRSVLVDSNLSGLLLGMNVSTSPEEIYRALMEAAAFGKRVIIDAFEHAGIPIDRLVACGGLSTRSPLLMQIYADATGREISVAASQQAPALGAALLAAVAAGEQRGGFATVQEAARAMASPPARVYVPDPSSTAVYDDLYRDYQTLHDYFGREQRALMGHLKDVRRAQFATREG